MSRITKWEYIYIFLSDTSTRSEEKSEKMVLSDNAIQWETWITDFSYSHINVRIIDYDLIIFSTMMSYAIRVIECVDQESIKYTRPRYQWKWNDFRNLKRNDSVTWSENEAHDLCKRFFVNRFWSLFKNDSKMQNRIAFRKYKIFCFWQYDFKKKDFQWIYWNITLNVLNIYMWGFQFSYRFYIN